MDRARTPAGPEAAPAPSSTQLLDDGHPGQVLQSWGGRPTPVITQPITQGTQAPPERDGAAESTGQDLPG